MNMIIFKGETIIKLLTACKKELLKMNSQTLQLSQLYAIFLFISIHKMWTNPADYYNIVNHSSNVRVQTPNKHFCACPKNHTEKAVEEELHQSFQAHIKTSHSPMLFYLTTQKPASPQIIWGRLWIFKK